MAAWQPMPPKQRFAAIDLLRIPAAPCLMAFHRLFYYPSYAAAFATYIPTFAAYAYLCVPGLFVTSPKLHRLLALDFAPSFPGGIAILLVRSESSPVVDRGLLAAALSLAFVFAAIGASVESDVFANRVRPNIWLTGAIVLAGPAAIYPSTIIQTAPPLTPPPLPLAGIPYPLYL